MEESPFIGVPSGLDIAKYFWNETERTHGCEGIDLWRDGRAYCYLWRTAMVDLDMNEYYLLEIRTAMGSRDFDETRDFLFVAAGVSVPSGIEAEWHNKPVAFGATFDEHIEHLDVGLKWFYQSVIEYVERFRN